MTPRATLQHARKQPEVGPSGLNKCDSPARGSSWSAWTQIDASTKGSHLYCSRRHSHAHLISGSISKTNVDTVLVSLFVRRRGGMDDITRPSLVLRMSKKFSSGPVWSSDAHLTTCNNCATTNSELFYKYSTCAVFCRTVSDRASNKIIMFIY